MLKSDWLTVASLVIGLLGLYASSTTGSGILLVLSIFILVSFLVLVFYTLWRFNLPSWTVIGRRFELEIMDREGKLAHVIKTHEIRANHSGLIHYRHRNLSCDGVAANFQPDSISKIITSEKEAGDYNITIAFKHQIERWKSTLTSIEFDFVDSFTDDNEYLIALVPDRSRWLEMEVKFPENRLPKQGTVKMHLLSAGSEAELDPPEVKDRVIKWSIRKRVWNLPTGEYALSWDW